MFKYADVFMMVKQALDAGVYDIPQRFKNNRPKSTPKESMPEPAPRPGITQTLEPSVSQGFGGQNIPKIMPKPGKSQTPGSPAATPEPMAKLMPRPAPWMQEVPGRYQPPMQGIYRPYTEQYYQDIDTIKN